MRALVAQVVQIPEQRVKAVVPRVRGHARTVKVGKVVLVDSEAHGAKVAKVGREVRTRKAHPVVQVVRVPLVGAAMAVARAHSL